MANSYFKFKQFTIHQNKCAMKVCTDACLFGALVASCKTCLPTGRLPVTSDAGQLSQCLEIGTGTGLLSLMLAQKKINLQIDAVEIDTAAATQAAENIAASAWAGRIQVFNEDILNFTVKKKYNFIVSNPPFFEDDLQSFDKATNDAKHDTALNLSQLLQVVDKYLQPQGFFAALLPYHRVAYFIEEAKKLDLFLSKQILVKHTLKHKFFRGILFFNRKETETQFLEIIIRDAEHNYTPQFAAALKDYYLFL
jgi:tRNA1Val (adenine37-N6)-methyltransferase